jgi:hypothetical protein
VKIGNYGRPQKVRTDPWKWNFSKRNLTLLHYTSLHYNLQAAVDWGAAHLNISLIFEEVKET